MASIRSGWRPCRGGFGEIPHGIDATPGQSDQSLDCCLRIADLFGHRDGRAEVRLGGLAAEPSHLPSGQQSEAFGDPVLGFRGVGHGVVDVGHGLAVTSGAGLDPPQCAVRGRDGHV
jgi:hypothetical protein